jgi:hypothetical protein
VQGKLFVTNRPTTTAAEVASAIKVKVRQERRRGKEVGLEPEKMCEEMAECIGRDTHKRP